MSSSTYWTISDVTTRDVYFVISYDAGDHSGDGVVTTSMVLDDDHEVHAVPGLYKLDIAGTDVEKDLESYRFYQKYWQGLRQDPSKSMHTLTDGFYNPGSIMMEATGYNAALILTPGNPNPEERAVLEYIRDIGAWHYDCRFLTEELYAECDAASTIAELDLIVPKTYPDPPPDPFAGPARTEGPPIDDEAMAMGASIHAAASNAIAGNGFRDIAQGIRRKRMRGFTGV